MRGSRLFSLHGILNDYNSVVDISDKSAWQRAPRNQIVFTALTTKKSKLD